MATKIIPGEGVKSEMDLFLSPLVTKQIEWIKYVAHQATAPLDNSDVIEFIVHPIRDQYIYLANTKLYIRGKYVNAKTGEELHEKENFCPVNLPGHSLFNQCTVLFNDKQVSSGAQTFQHTSYIETLTNFKKSTKETALQTAIYSEDTPNQFDNVTFTPNQGNLGANKRNKWAAKSALVEMSIKLHSPVFNLDKYLPGNVKINVRLTKAPGVFYIMRADTSKTGAAGADAPGVDIRFQFTHMELQICRVKPVANAWMAHQKILMHQPARYILPYVDTKMFSIPSTFSSITFDNIFLDLIPSRIILFMIDVDAFNGTYKKNPYEMKHNNINYIALIKDGERYPPEGYTLDFTKNKFIQCYEDMLECLNLDRVDKNNGITPTMYQNGYTFFTWDLTPDRTAGTSNFNQPLDGTLRLEMKFKEALGTNVNVFVYGESKNMMEIDFNGDVTLDHEKRKNLF